MGLRAYSLIPCGRASIPCSATIRRACSQTHVGPQSSFSPACASPGLAVTKPRRRSGGVGPLCI
eukprot:11194134-Lingulodinium_polyedra.AAC.1